MTENNFYRFNSINGKPCNYVVDLNDIHSIEEYKEIVEPAISNYKVSDNKVFTETIKDEIAETKYRITFKMMNIACNDKAYNGTVWANTDKEMIYSHETLILTRVEYIRMSHFLKISESPAK